MSTSTKKERNKKKLIFCVLFGIYLLGLAWLLFFADMMDRSYADRTYRYNLIPFTEIRRFLTHWRRLGLVSVLGNLLGNILVFIPFGFALPTFSKRFHSFFFVTLLTFEFSFAIELIQLVTRVGIFDVDDIILNTLGGAIGYILWRIVTFIRRKKRGSTNKEKSQKL